MTTPARPVGQFSDDGLEYVLNSPHTPHRDWFNFYWNPHYLACGGSGLNGFSLFQNEAGVLTNLFGKQDMREEPRAIFLRDKQTGEVWRAGYAPGEAEPEHYTCRHGLGYTVLTTKQRGIEVQLRVFVPRHLAGAVWSVTVSNRSGRARDLSLFTAARIRLDGINLPYGYLSGLTAAWQPRERLLFFRNLTHTVAHEKYRAFMYCSRPPRRWDASEEAFLGRAHDFARPEGVRRGQLSNSAAAAEPMVGALQHDLRLPAGRAWSAHYVLGVVHTLAEARGAVRRHGTPAQVERAFNSMRADNLRRLCRFSVTTPNADFNRLFSVWLKHQLFLMADWARFYFKGYRDTCQDAAGMSVLDPGRARLMLHKALLNQRSDGFAPRAFRVPSMDVAAADKHYADSPAWISHASEALLRETGDLGRLDEIVPYSDRGSATVWEHNRQAVDFLWHDRGRHGLSKIHYGDWNDLMDKVGVRGLGEGVWMSFALARALKSVERMAGWKGDRLTAARCRRRYQILAKAIWKHGWDGRQFLYAINDDGLRIGTQRGREGRIFINPQSWAMLSGVLTPEAYAGVMRHMEPQVDTPVGPVHHWPPFTAYQDGIGQLSGTPEGFFTNGNVYCHAAAFKIAADLAAGRTEQAFATLLRILPTADKSEPFAQANGYVGPTALRATRHVSDDPWRTGTVAWHFLNVVDGFLGFRREPAGVRFAPQLPKAWPRVQFVRPFRGLLFRCELARGPKPGVWVEGQLCPGNFYPVPPGPNRARTVHVRCVV